MRYIDRFEKVDVKLRRKQASSQFIALYPRYILEAIAILLLTNIAYNLGKGEIESNIKELIPSKVPPPIEIPPSRAQSPSLYVTHVVPLPVLTISALSWNWYIFLAPFPIAKISLT